MGQKNKEGNYYRGRANYDGTFTTGRVARMFGVTPRTVGKWCDEGKLKSMRLPMIDNNTKGGERRIQRADIIAFAMQYRFPIPHILKQFEELPTVVIFNLDTADLAKLTTSMNGVQAKVIDDAFQLGSYLAGEAPGTVSHIVIGDVTGQSTAFGALTLVKNLQQATLVDTSIHLCLTPPISQQTIDYVHRLTVHVLPVNWETVGREIVSDYHALVRAKNIEQPAVILEQPAVILPPI